MSNLCKKLNWNWHKEYFWVAFQTQIKLCMENLKVLNNREVWRHNEGGQGMTNDTVVKGTVNKNAPVRQVTTVTLWMTVNISGWLLNWKQDILPDRDGPLAFEYRDRALGLA